MEALHAPLLRALLMCGARGRPESNAEHPVDIQTFLALRPGSLLLVENKFPVIIANGNELTVVVKVDETPSLRVVPLTGEVCELIVAVDMHLVGSVPDLPTL